MRHPGPEGSFHSLLFAASLFAFLPGAARAEVGGDTLSPSRLKRMTLEELMEIEVTLVSRRPEKLTDAASAIQVITREDIRRSGAATLPEALRLAYNLHVARVGASAFAISARGMNSTGNTLANKLLVMIDGRSVYTPLWSGVFWDVQHLVLDNIDRIEVVSGPGGSVWGANAVNGIINIVTVPASETQGLYVEAAAGTFLRDLVSARYGGGIGKDLAWRVHGQRIDHNSSSLPGGGSAGDPWNLTRGGFRMDWTPTDRDAVAVHGELMAAGFDQAAPRPDDSEANGQYVQARWNHGFSGTADFQAEAYFDRSWRDIPLVFHQDLRTYDVDVLHRFAPFRGNQLQWGGGYRLQVDDVGDPPASPAGIQLIPGRKYLHLYSGYFQDQQGLLDDRLRLTLGTRVEHNVYTGWEVMPSARAAWSITPPQTLWAAISRAVRSPGRLDIEAFTPPRDFVTDSTVALEGGPNLGSEKLHAYELGWRLAWADRAALSVAGFVHSYEELRIVEMVEPFRFQFTNGMRGEIYGLELSGAWQAAPWWRLRGGYTRLHRDLYPIPGHVELPQPGNQGNDPAWHGSIHSFLDLPRDFGINGAARWVAELPSPSVPSYFTFDLGATWRWRGVEADIVGRNLAESRHPEFRLLVTDEPQGIPRSILARISWRM